MKAQTRVVLPEGVAMTPELLQKFGSYVAIQGWQTRWIENVCESCGAVFTETSVQETSEGSARKFRCGCGASLATVYKHSDETNKTWLEIMASRRKEAEDYVEKLRIADPEGVIAAMFVRN